MTDYEGFWENILDITFTVLKAILALFVIRCILILADVHISVPILDPMLQFVLDYLGEALPYFKFKL